MSSARRSTHCWRRVVRLITARIERSQDFIAVARPCAPGRRAGVLVYRQQHAVPDKAALVPTEKLDLGRQERIDGNNALDRLAGPARIELGPQPPPREAKPDLAGRTQATVALFRDEQRF